MPDGYDRARYAARDDEQSGKASFYVESGRALHRFSFPLDDFTFLYGNICFALSKDRQGLPLSLADLCDSFVHVPHIKSGAHNEPLLDTPSCLSILLHTYTNWAGYDERIFQGHKFEVARSGRAKTDEIAKANERVVARTTMAKEVDAIGDEGILGLFFEGGSDGEL